MALDARPLEATLNTRHTLPSRTLVVAPNWVGDNVMAIPVLEALAATGRSLTVLARPHLRSLLDAVAVVESVVVRAASDSETIREIRSIGFEEAVILPNSFRSALLAFRAGIPVRWGYRGDLRALLLEPALPRPEGLRHQLTDYDALLERLGAAIPARVPHLDLTRDQKTSGRQALSAAGIPFAAEARRIGVFPGAEFGPSKRWPPKNFAALLAELYRDGFETVLIAGPGEEALAERVRSDSGVQVPIVGPRLDLAELAAVLSQLDSLVTNDSGPMHLAAAVGTPCIALFGPTNPTRTAPSGETHKILYTRRWCSPCFKKRCPLLHQRCMRDISVERVVRSLAETPL